jgi:hypothetical protein
MTKPRDLATLGGGFTQSGTGAIQRTVENKLKDTVSVKDFGAVGDGVADDTQAFLYAAATGRPIRMPQGNYVISQPVTIQSGFFGDGAGDINVNGKTKITLTGTGQLIVGDAYCQWDGFEVRSAVNNKTLIVNPGQSYWTFTNFVVNKLGAATGQIGIEFNTSSASIYFNRLDNINIRCDYPIKVTGNSTQVFNANKIGMGVGGNKWYNFLSAITVESGVLACDANEFGGYFETGTNIITFSGNALRQNRFRIISDAVTRIWNSSVAITDSNIWEVLDGSFTYTGTQPQNQQFIGPISTKVRATNTSVTNVGNAVATVLTYDNEQFDTLSEFAPGTGVFQPRYAGYYLVESSCMSASVAWTVGQRWEIRIYKNGTEYAKGDWNVADASTTRQRMSKVCSIVFMNGTSDTLDTRIIHNQGSTVATDTAPTANFINIARL